MNLGNSLFNARKKSGLSQEDVAGKLGVSRQTISKWETGETLPDTRQSKNLAVLYQEEVEVEKYAGEMKRMLESLKRDYGYNDTDAGLVLKDILAHAWNSEI